MSKYEKGSTHGSTARTCEEARRVICASCGIKVKCVKNSHSACLVTERFAELLSRFRWEEYSQSDANCPFALSDTSQMVPNDSHMVPNYSKMIQNNF